MAKESKTTAVEFEPDAWQRFERAVDVVAKSPPQHREAKPKRRKSPRKSTAKKPASEHRGP